ncbi:MAG: hypothetical protein LUH36_09655, partial [Oscillospiraceae bacterium]|nr:hypothetical protein [Oscillospiraceae bacterium]
GQAAQDLFSGQGVFDPAPSWAGSVQYSQGTAGLVMTVELSGGPPAIPLYKPFLFRRRKRLCCSDTPPEARL